jgi:hypothetical protein
MSDNKIYIGGLGVTDHVQKMVIWPSLEKDLRRWFGDEYVDRNFVISQYVPHTPEPVLSKDPAWYRKLE